mmetsp:Transcript_10779/g.24629  ORF Transcript_10779/g.24629 Transcript_10779/m.24629 type:complete len:482 (-) Transcript_10779:137-1582(-)
MSMATAQVTFTCGREQGQMTSPGSHAPHRRRISSSRGRRQGRRSLTPRRDGCWKGPHEIASDSTSYACVSKEQQESVDPVVVNDAGTDTGGDDMDAPALEIVSDLLAVVVDEYVEEADCDAWLVLPTAEPLISEEDYGEDLFADECASVVSCYNPKDLVDIDDVVAFEMADQLLGEAMAIADGTKQEVSSTLEVPARLAAPSTETPELFKEQVAAEGRASCSAPALVIQRSWRRYVAGRSDAKQGVGSDGRLVAMAKDAGSSVVTVATAAVCPSPPASPPKSNPRKHVFAGKRHLKAADASEMRHTPEPGSSSASTGNAFVPMAPAPSLEKPASPPRRFTGMLRLDVTHQAKESSFAVYPPPASSAAGRWSSCPPGKVQPAADIAPIEGWPPKEKISPRKLAFKYVAAGPPDQASRSAMELDLCDFMQKPEMSTKRVGPPREPSSPSFLPTLVKPCPPSAIAWSKQLAQVCSPRQRGDMVF